MAVLLLKWDRGLVEEKLVSDVEGVCIMKLAEAGAGGAGVVGRQEEEEGGANAQWITEYSFDVCFVCFVVIA